MKERPILFNAEMVNAILSGRKTQTRRVMNVQPDSTEFESRFIIDSTKRSEIGKWCWAEPDVFVNPRRSELFSCPFGEIGDRLWVREACQAKELQSGLDVVFYAADSTEIPVPAHPLDAGRWVDLYRYRAGKGKRVPSIHMPRWASRITLEITGVRVERLASVSDEDAKREGYPDDPQPYGGRHDKWLWFRQLWDSIYPEQSFKVNPWVWIIEFKRVDGEE